VCSYFPYREVSAHSLGVGRLLVAPEAPPPKHAGGSSVSEEQREEARGERPEGSDEGDGVGVGESGRPLSGGPLAEIEAA